MSRSTTAKSFTSYSSLISQGDEFIKVVVRVRPPNDNEISQEYATIVDCLDKKSIQIKYDPSLPPPIKPTSFDRVLPEQTTQEELFVECGMSEIIDSAMCGFSCTVFAYGQTGSGKTFTMTGLDPTDMETMGIVPRAMQYIYQKIATSTSKYVVSSGYLEIYNEHVRDLLNPGGPLLPVRWHKDRGFYVENAFVVECEVLDDCRAVLEEGLRNRAVGSHALNERSSRSHSILTLHISCHEFCQEDNRMIRKYGKISFVDLAGSERQKKSKSTGDTLVEANSINKSLLILGHCISMLAERKKNHIPYRDSVLTKLLMDSIGGSGHTLMVACVAPTQYSATETVQTLRYAARAKRIRNKPRLRQDPLEELINKLKLEIKELKIENEQYKNFYQSNQMEKIKQQNQKMAQVHLRRETDFLTLKRENEVLKQNKQRVSKTIVSSAEEKTQLENLKKLQKDLGFLDQEIKKFKK